MPSAAAPPPIAGTPVDPPPAEVPGYAQRLDRSRLGGIAYRALRRYSYGNVGLLANGTAYYLILSLFSLVAFAYGVVTIVGADRLAELLTESLEQALPGLVGADGIDPEVLRSTGRTAGLVGLVLLLWGGLGAVGAASSAIHLVFGAPPDPRPFPKAKGRHLLILAMVAPLIMVTFATSSLTSSYLTPALDAVGLGSGPARYGVAGASLLVSFALDAFIVWLLLGWMGGIKPDRRPRLAAAVIGAILVSLIKALLGLLIGWVLDRPQYGAFAAPLAVLFVFSLLAQALYISAAIAAGIADADRPLEALHPAQSVGARAAPEPAENGE